MQPDVFIVRPKSRWPSSELPFLWLSSLAIGVLPAFVFVWHGWRAGLAALPLGLIGFGFGWYLFSEWRRLRRSRLEIDAQRQVLAFCAFRFVSRFLPERVQERVEIPFADVIDVERTEVRRGLWGLQVRTPRGRVMVSEEMAQFEFIRDTLIHIVAGNQANAETYRALCAREPKIRTAWYGWLILLTAIAAAVYLGWKFMYQE